MRSHSGASYIGMRGVGGEDMLAPEVTRIRNVKPHKTCISS